MESRAKRISSFLRKLTKMGNKPEQIKPADVVINTAIHHCTCVSRYQDDRYGVGKRVHNVSHKNKASRCTVCGGTRLG